MATKIYGMGNPLLDISAEVDDSWYQKYDLQPANAILADAEKHGPLYEELAALPHVQYIPGGATLNSIRVAKWMLQQPDVGSYTGCIGKDKFGDIMNDKCKGEGLNTPFLRIDEHPTGTCGVLVKGKERSLVANLAAANAFKEDHLETAEVKAAIEGAGIYYSAGFFLTVSVPSLLAVGKHAQEKNKIFCMNLSAPFIIQFFGEQLHQCMPFVDILFSNEDEARQYSSTNNLGTEDLGEIAQKIVALPKNNAGRPRTVVFTQGKDATVVATPDGVQKFPVEPLDADKIVDTNGAGDAFVGGYLSQLALGKDVERCVLAGHYAAREIIQRSGCAFPDKPSFQ